MTTIHTGQLGVAVGDAQAIIDTARASTNPYTLDLGEYHLVTTPDGVVQVDLTGDPWRDRAGLTPRRKVGNVLVRDVPSFLTYFTKHATEHAEIFANRDASAILAVLDAHTPAGGDPQWEEHRVTLALRHSDQFKAWQAISGRMLSQTAFAEFIEDNRSAIVTPDAATVLELAQTFQANTKVTFKSSTLIKSGQRQLTYVESIDASAGSRGQIDVPDSLQLALQVYDGAQVADEVTARLRFRIDGDGRLVLGIVLDQLTDVVNAAFEGVVAEVIAGVGETVPVLRGTPA